MNPQNGKGDKRLHDRQQCTNSEMASNWERAFGNKKKAELEKGHYEVTEIFNNKSVGYWDGEKWSFIGDSERYAPGEIELEVIRKIKLDFDHC